METTICLAEEHIRESAHDVFRSNTCETNDGAKTKLWGAPCATSTPIANEQGGMSPAAKGGALVARLCAGRAERKVAGTNIGQCRQDRPTSQQVDVMAGKQAIRRRFTSADPTTRDTHARVILEGEKATAEFRQSAGQRR
ncbi:hypothetical protein Tcan_08159 [Toxocara canis]|uniref:Uncharacterized protein n=1 Tax=Toxocara canis TaxID=6265 RepID=A0A0B2VSR4_TOXCA|nr:hypothetical protein Tcan_08159 [Toxocara canis]